jgi:hypothetical protein
MKLTLNIYINSLILHRKMNLSINNNARWLTRCSSWPNELGAGDGGAENKEIQSSFFDNIGNED